MISNGMESGRFNRGVTERGVFAFACQYIVSLCGRTGNRTVTQTQHPVLGEGRPNCARQSLASTLSVLAVAATSCCHPGRHANVVTLCLLTPLLLFKLGLPKLIFLERYVMSHGNDTCMNHKYLTGISVSLLVIVLGNKLEE